MHKAQREKGVSLKPTYFSGERKRRELTLITQRPLPGAPLEALNDAVFD